MPEEHSDFHSVYAGLEQLLERDPCAGAGTPAATSSPSPRDRRGNEPDVSYNQPPPDYDPDVQAIEILGKVIGEGNNLVENKNLELEPRLMPEFFLADEADLLLVGDTVALPSGRGCWKKQGREMGRGIKGRHSNEYVGIKRSFGFHTSNEHGNESKTTWNLTVYFLIELLYLDTTKILCRVHQRSGQPNFCLGSSLELAVLLQGFRSAERLPLAGTQNYSSPNSSAGAGLLPRVENRDPNSSAAAGPYYAGSGTRITSAKKRKSSSSSVLSNFTAVHASIGPQGKALALLICNSCGVVYKKSSGTGTLGNHKCNDHPQATTGPDGVS